MINSTTSYILTLFEYTPALGALLHTLLYVFALSWKCPFFCPFYNINWKGKNKLGLGAPLRGAFKHNRQPEINSLLFLGYSFGLGGGSWAPPTPKIIGLFYIYILYKKYINISIDNIIYISRILNIIVRLRLFYYSSSFSGIEIHYPIILN